MTDKNQTRDLVKTIISEIAGQQANLTIPRIFIKLTGSLEAALLLSQIIYWTDRATMKDGWFAKSYDDWQDELTLSKYQVMTAVKKLKDAGVETCVKKFNGFPTVHYHLDSETLSQWLVKKFDERKSNNLTNESEKTSQSSTENTANTTTDITDKDSFAPSGAGSAVSTPAKIDAFDAVVKSLESGEMPARKTVEETDTPASEVDNTPPTGSAAPPPDAFDMTHLRDVVAHMWFEFNKPKQLLSKSNAKAVKRFNPIIDTIVDTFPDATDDRHAWVALEFCTHWKTKKDDSGKALNMPLDASKFGIHWRKWLNEHPAIVAAMGGELVPVPITPTGLVSLNSQKPAPAQVYASGAKPFEFDVKKGG